MWKEPWFWIIVAVVVILLFGAPRLPVFAKSLSQSMNIFRREMRNGKDKDGAAAEAAAEPVAADDTKPNPSV